MPLYGNFRWPVPEFTGPGRMSRRPGGLPGHAESRDNEPQIVADAHGQPKRQRHCLKHHPAGYAGRDSRSEYLSPREGNRPTGFAPERDAADGVCLRGCGQPVVLAYQPAAGSAFNFRLDRTDAGPRAETEGDVDPVGVRQLFLEPGRKAIGWHDVEARARGRASRPPPRRTGPGHDSAGRPGLRQ